MKFITSMFLAHASLAAARNSLSRTPPMGWMSWLTFRCETNCSADPDCISEGLYRGQADALASQGFLAAGYDGIHMDDCWERKEPPRDPSTNELAGDPERFPSGMKALGDYYHSKGVKFGLYTAEAEHTCNRARYPGSRGYEALDAATFAEWGVDYLKLDGCGADTTYYETGYAAMGLALQASGRPIELSCSWPAYINGGNETLQQETFIKMINYGCNGWRNWHDIGCGWGSVSSIIDHWGMYGSSLQPFAGPGHWHDMDMLLIGAGCMSLIEEQTQMAIWAISASPLIMGSDLRNMPQNSKDILLNEHAIAVSQDPLGQMGIRLTEDAATQVWARKLANADVAVALYNHGDGGEADVVVSFDVMGVNLYGSVEVFDIWSKTIVGNFSTSYTAKAVPPHGTVFLRLSNAVREVSLV